jgi:phosphoribosylformylglycinamidine synthase I
MKFGIVVFPGSNCDADAYHAVVDALGEQAVYLWHKDHDLQDVDVVVLPGGFAYGDYLRAGAIARFSPIMRSVEQYAARGGPVLAICNGFQVACEAGLLPGALLRNAGLQFICEPVRLRVESTQTMFTADYSPGQILHIPIAHGEGRYHADATTLDRLEGEGRVVMRYDGLNPNGSARDIAGIVNDAGNVLGLMPHPERACDTCLGSTDGLGIFTSLLSRVAA